MKEVRIHQQLTSKKLVILFAALLSFMIAVAGFWFYRAETKRITLQKGKTLTAIGSLKVDQIQHFYLDELKDARIISANPILWETAHRFMQTAAPADQKRLIGVLNQIKMEHEIAEVILTSLQGRMIASTNDLIGEIEEIELKSIRSAVQQGNSVFTDIYKYSRKGEQKILISFISIVEDSRNTPALAIIFRLDPHQFLYPLLESWPTKSQSAETYLFRIERDSILYLSDLRHLENPALNPKLPISSVSLPATKAAKGYTGVLEGKDYRGEEVVAYVTKIDGTPWYLVSKVDKREMYEEVPVLTLTVLGFVLASILLAIGLIAFLYNQRQQTIYKELYHKEKEIWKQQEQFKVTMDSLGDGVIVTDMNGTVQYMNKHAEVLTGWELSEAKDRHLGDIYSVKNEKTGQFENNILEKVLKHGLVKELANHTLLISKNGKEIPVMDTGALIRDSGGSVIGIVVTFQDESDKRIQQRLLEQSETFIRSVLASLTSHIAVIDASGKIISVNEAWERFGQQNGETVLARTSVGSNYFEACGKAIARGDAIAAKALAGLKSILNNEVQLFEMDYPCHSLSGQRWFYLRAMPFIGNNSRIVVAHSCITPLRLAEAALKQSEERYRVTLNHLPGTSWAVDRDLRFTVSQGKALASIGLKPDEVVGMTLYEFFQTDDPSHIAISHHLKAIAGNSVSYEQTHLGVVFHTVLSPIRNSEGDVTGVAGISIDITSRKQTEAALRQSDARFNMLVTEIDDVVWTATLDGKEILDVNKTFEDVYGISMSDFKSNPGLWHEMVHPDDQPNAAQTSEDLFNYGRAQGEYRIVRPDGRIVWLFDKKSLIYNESGDPVMIGGIARDITEKKLAEEKLLRNEQVLSSILETQQELIARWLPDTTLTFVNKAYCKFFGLSEQELIGRKFLEFIPQSEWESELNKLINLSPANPSFTTVSHALKPDGAIISLERTVTAILDEKKNVVELQCTGHDITEKLMAEQEIIKAKEKAEASDKLKTAFLNNISHEIRTPLNGILSFVQILSEMEVTPEERVEYFNYIQQSSDRLLNTITDYMDMAMLFSGTMDVHREDFLLKSFFEEILEKSKARCAEKHLLLETAIPREPPDLKLFTDKEILEKALLKLMDNAVKFTDEGKISIGYKVYGDRLEFTIRDSGRGIAEDKLKIIFDIFMQEETGPSRSHEGSGLGLPIAKGMVDLLGGTIHAQSEMGKGSTFSIAIPTR